LSFTEATIYSVGFKGLPDGWKTLKPVTFVTGENSSGKTSLLDLIDILDSHEFNLNNDVLGATDESRDWFDILSKFGDGKSLTIGFIGLDSRKEKPTFRGRVVTFKRNGDDLDAVFATTVTDNYAIKIRRAGTQFLAKKFTARGDNLTIAQAAKMVEGAHFDKSRGYVRVHSTNETGVVTYTDWLTANATAGMKLLKDDFPSNEIRQALFPLGGPPFKTYRYGPIRGETKQFYPASASRRFDPAGAHFPYLLKAISDDSKSALAAVKRFGQSSGLFDDVYPQELGRAGQAQVFSILYEKLGKAFLGSELGYGLGQVMPIATDLICASRDSTFLIQQPEVHLHPRAQAAFGSLLFETSKDRRFLIVETHSDFVIDRFRLELAKSEEQRSAQILFFELSETIRRPKFSRIDIGRDGTLQDAPHTYRQFFADEELEIFRNL